METKTIQVVDLEDLLVHFSDEEAAEFTEVLSISFTWGDTDHALVGRSRLAEAIGKGWSERIGLANVPSGVYIAL